MNRPEVLEDLGRLPVFTSREAKTLLGSSSAQTNLQLHRMRSAGLIYEIEKGKYTLHRDPFLVASRIVWPSYISFWSALRYHDLTEQVPQAVWVVTSRRRKRSRLRFAGAEIFFTVTKQRNLFGYDKKVLRGFEVFIADPEKAVVDSLLFRKISVQEIHDILRHSIGRLRPARIIDYAARTGNRALARRLGLMLERLGADFSDRFAGRIYPQSVLLDPAASPKGRLDQKWKVIENVVL
jgi:predicted transcriptional regulator of viral defense system